MAKRKRYDFAGWATKNNIRCLDGRTIRRDAFADQDGMQVPLVYSHNHDDISKVLGHGVLENRPEGVYIYGKFNNTPEGQHAKECVENGDINSLSIWANNLVQAGGDVLHGVIREVSLVLSGANDGAKIETPYLQHGDGEMEALADEAFIYTGEEIMRYEDSEEFLAHGYDDDELDDENYELDDEDYEDDDEEGDYEDDGDEDFDDDEDAEDDDDEDVDVDEEEVEDFLGHSAFLAHGGETNMQEIIDNMDDDERAVLAYLVGKALEDAEGEDIMKHNVFDAMGAADDTVYLSHDAVHEIMDDIKSYGSLKDSVIAHAATYGIEDIDTLFPEPKDLNMPPEFVKRNTDWVAKVMNGVHHTPFSRIKSRYADLREDEARAKGYIKGRLKKEEVFKLMKRETTPTTIYKKQKLDRDDILDITDFDVIVWIKKEMRIMLEEECARAILISDGRDDLSEDKIREENIRPIYKEHDFFAVKERFFLTAEMAADEQKRAKAFIKMVKRSRKDYKGSGNPTLFTTEDVITDCLMLEDGIGRPLYDTIEKLKTVLRVSDIVPVEVMEGLQRRIAGADFFLDGILVNLTDYNVGTDRGGQVSFFDDFDIDYNQQKYLMEGRFSGALVKPFSALIFEHCIGNEVPAAALTQTKTLAEATEDSNVTPGNTDLPSGNESGQGGQG